MLSFVQYTQCPACSSKNINAAFSVKDYTVSQENFVVWNCNNCTLRFTQSIPAQNDIAQYYKSDNYISHSDTKDGFVSQMYHIVRNITLKSKRRLLNKYNKKEKGKLLDIGAGTGAFAQIMQQNEWQVTGLEPDDLARKIAKQKSNLDLQDISVFKQLTQKSFTAITLWHVLEHVHELHEYFKKFNEILEDNGKLIIAVPNYTSFDASWYKEFWAAYDVPRHLYHFSPSSLTQLATQYGFSLVTQKRMLFDSFYVSILSGKYKHGYTNFIGAFLIGLASNINALLHKDKCSSLIYVFEKTT